MIDTGWYPIYFYDIKMKTPMKHLLLLFAALLVMWGCSDDNETGGSVPAITTAEVTSVNSTEATTGGDITTSGTLTARGVVWSTSENPTIELTTKTNDGTGTGIFKSFITGLQANTTYHVRAYATTSTGTAYGNDVVFKTGTPKLYICGTEYSPTIGQQQCKVWIEGAASFWGGDKESIGQGLFVSGTDLYVTGSTKNTTFRATYWKNGTPTHLTDDIREAIGRAIFVQGNDVYVTGYEKNTESVKVAKYWKNGEAFNLTDGTKDAEGMSIAVLGDDVYVSGFETATAGPHIWKNGVRMNIENITGPIVNALCISGGDLYATGTKTAGNSDIWYWKNETGVQLPEALATRAITVSGSSVYVAGQNTSFQAVYWKNESIVVLDESETPGGSEAKSIFVSGENVYVVGKIGQDIVYWKNGVLVKLSANPDFRNNGMGIAFK